MYAIRSYYAVAVGMVIAARLSAKAGYCSPEDAMLIEKHVPISAEARIFTKKMSANKLYQNMLGDKKNDMGKIKFILIRITSYNVCYTKLLRMTETQSLRLS